MIEPSDQERSELPETTAKYIEDLEQDNKRLREALERITRVYNTCGCASADIATEALEGE